MTKNYQIVPHTPNMVKFESPNWLWLVVENGKMLAVCMSKQDAERVMTGLTNYWSLGD